MKLIAFNIMEVVQKPDDGRDGEPPAKNIWVKEGESSTSSQQLPDEDMVKMVVRSEDKVLGKRLTKRKVLRYGSE